MVNKLTSLRRKSDFQQISQNGKSIKSCPWFLIKFIENQENSNRYGWTISKKVGNAVIRNRIRRWLREYFRHKELANTLDINVILFPQKNAFYKNLEWEDFERDFDKAWNRLKKRINSASS